MHELGIAESAIRSSLKEMEAHGARTLISLTLRIGKMSSVEPEALRFAFEAATKSSGLEEANLVIEEVDAVAFCRQCNYSFATGDDVFFMCPKCGDFTSELIQGKEIELARIEME